jgi:hypothetical protein
MNDDNVTRLESIGSHQTATDMLELLSMLAWLSHCCSDRGEYLHAHQYLSDAVDQVLRMLRRFAAADGYAKVCLAAPRRRLGSVAPALSRELLAVLLGTVAVPEARLLEIAEQRLRASLPALDWDEVRRVRERILGGGAAPVRLARAEKVLAASRAGD